MANVPSASPHIIRSRTGKALRHRSPLGVMHPHHPAYCNDPACRAWADELTLDEADGISLVHLRAGGSPPTERAGGEPGKVGPGGGC